MSIIQLISGGSSHPPNQWRSYQTRGLVIMQTLAQQINAATLRKPINQWHPATLTNEEGKQKPAFVRTGQFAKGDCTYHVQIIKRVKRLEEIIWLKEFYRLQKNGEFVFVTDETITDERSNLWIETHKKGATLE